jgi:DNA modification methylase
MREKTIVSVVPVHRGMVHPTEKPVRLAERIITLISDPGDTIYDPFMGSGSFGVACVKTGRNYIGSEVDKEYFTTACKRIKKTARAGELFASQEAQ